MNEDKREMIRMIGRSRYLLLLIEQHQLKVFLGWFAIVIALTIYSF